MNRSATFRFAAEPGFDTIQIEAKFRASFQAAAVGKSAGYCYLRGEQIAGSAAFGADLERLPQGCEVFEFVAPSVAAAQRLQLEITGRGGLGDIHSITRNDADAAHRIYRRSFLALRLS